MSAGAAASPEASAEAKDLVEVNKDNFQATIDGAGGRLVVVDCYTDWCGPCKMIKPTLVEWAEELAGKVDIVKFNCNKYNKDLGIEVRERGRGAWRERGRVWQGA